MENNLSSANMISGSTPSFDLQATMRPHHHQQPQPNNMNNNPFILHQHHHHHRQQQQQASMVHPSSIPENFPMRMNTMQQDCDRHTNQTISLTDFAKGKSCVSDEEEPSFAEDGHEAERKNNQSTWHRVKWNDPMVRLLITAVSYIGEDSASTEYGSRRKYSNLQKKGKWKSVSKVMAERGHFVSPQQCEDKFNDLNKRYKRLNEILGRGISCEVVEKPVMLESMNHISDKMKEEVRKILSSKHLYYEEMCSYHNGNRLHLPPDPELQRSLRLALRSRDDHDDHDEYDDHDHDEYDHDHHGLQLEQQSKRLKQCEGHEKSDVNVMDGGKGGMLQDQWMKHRMIQLEEQKVQLQAQMLELEKERFKWQRFRQKKDGELEMMRMENERMKLENEQMALELKRKEMCSDLS